MKKRVRVRFAPSPTGPLHIGGVRTALYNYLFAKREKGNFILRIEDTDQNRYIPEAEDYIIRSLKWCGIEPDEGTGFGEGDYGPYRQSERTHIYREYAENLIRSGKAYYAFDSQEDLNRKRLEREKEGEKFQYDSTTRMNMKNSLFLDEAEVNVRLKEDDYVIRFLMPEAEDVIFNDLIRNKVTFNTRDLDDKILLKADGFPTYHLANVVDDYLMKISHVIRGEEWLPSTPLHVMLYRALGWEKDMPSFAHLPLIMNPGGKGKLSKRDGTLGGYPVFPLNWKDSETGEMYSGYKEAGFLPEAFLNILALLGWHHEGENEVYSLEVLVNDFSLDRVVKSGARFDYEKAKWINQQHLMRMDDTDLGEKLQSILKEKGIEVEERFAIKICGLMKERIHFLNEIPGQASYFFQEDFSYDEKMIRKKFKPENENLYKELIRELKETDKFIADSLENMIKSFIEKNNTGLGVILPVIRLCISGTLQGPSIFEIMELIGKDKVIKRMNRSLEYFSHNVF